MNNIEKIEVGEKVIIRSRESLGVCLFDSYFVDNKGKKFAKVYFGDILMIPLAENVYKYKDRTFIANETKVININDKLKRIGQFEGFENQDSLNESMSKVGYVVGKNTKHEQIIIEIIPTKYLEIV